jgi:hypothetical protein
MWETISGLEMIVGRRPCRLMQREWVDVSDVAAAGRIAVIAQSDASFGPVSLLLAGATSPVLVPESWSRRMIRGFSVSIFTRRIPAETERLLTEGRTLGVPADHPVLAAPVLLELSLERIPRGPLALPVILGASLPVGIARLDPKASSSEQLWVCDASAAHVTPFEVRLEQTNR